MRDNNITRYDEGRLGTKGLTPASIGVYTRIVVMNIALWIAQGILEALAVTHEILV